MGNLYVAAQSRDQRDPKQYLRGLAFREID